MDYLKGHMCGGVEYLHRLTGKPLKMVDEVHEHMLLCDECGEEYTYPFTTKRPAKWYKKENIVEHRLPGRDIYIRMYD